MKSILIATDGSPSAQEAVEVGLELAVEQGADVIFVHVAAPDSFANTRLASGRPLPHHEPVDESETALNAAAAAAEEAGVSYTLERISGETVDEIVDVANAKDVDLIVVGSRGRGTVASALLGSVSRGVLASAKRALLVVRGTRVHAGASS